MAINKNFVIKNGVEVNTNLLVGDSTLNMVGVGTTIPGYDLHVGRGAGGRGGIGATDLTVTGIATIGVANSTSGALSVTGISTFEGEILGQGGITARTAKVTDLTSTRLIIAGTGGELEDNANLTFGSGVFTVADNVSIGGSINVSGIATAQSLSIGATAVIDRNFQLKNIASLDSTTTATIESAIKAGPNIFDDLEVTGLSTFVGLGTFESGLWVAGIGTFENDVHFHGSSGVTTVTWDKSANSLNFNDNAKAQFGTGQDLSIYHDGTNAYLKSQTTGHLYIDAQYNVYIRDQDGSETRAVFDNDGAVELYYDNTKTFNTTPQGVNISGVTTSNRVYVTGVSTLTSVGSNLIPDADGSRNIGAAGSEWQDLYIDGTANIDALSADTAIIGDLTDNRVVIAGSSGELEDDTNFTYDGSKLVIGAGSGATVYNTGNATFVGIITAKAADLQTGPFNVGTAATISANGNATFSGVVTSTEYFKNGTIVPMGVGIGSTGNGDWSNFAQGLVGYGFTYLSFVGSGVSMVRYNSSLGIATVVIEGGSSSGSAGAAGTWSAYSSSGIATTKAIGVGTVGMAVTALQGGEKGASSGIGASFRGAYISNGMVVFDNELNDSHYIGTAFNGLMAGPVTVNGTMTVDGNWAVV